MWPRVRSQGWTFNSRKASRQTLSSEGSEQLGEKQLPENDPKSTVYPNNRVAHFYLRGYGEKGRQSLKTQGFLGNLLPRSSVSSRISLQLGLGAQ